MSWKKTKKVLPVNYQAQYDSETDQGGRMCRSSTYAMGLNFLKPGAIKGAGQLDDIYLRRVQMYGDTTQTEAQQRALLSYGQQSRFRTNCTLEELFEWIEKTGKPVPIGILHKGNIERPTGFGHWLLLVGYDNTKGRLDAIVHDPAGELDLINGGYALGGSGRYARYSVANLRRRFEVTPSGEFSPGAGWAVFLD